MTPIIAIVFLIIYVAACIYGICWLYRITTKFYTEADSIKNDIMSSEVNIDEAIRLYKRILSLQKMSFNKTTYSSKNEIYHFFKGKYNDYITECIERNRTYSNE